MLLVPRQARAILSYARNSARKSGFDYKRKTGPMPPILSSDACDASPIPIDFRVTINCVANHIYLRQPLETPVSFSVSIGGWRFNIFVMISVCVSVAWSKELSPQGDSPGDSGPKLEFYSWWLITNMILAARPWLDFDSSALLVSYCWKFFTKTAGPRWTRKTRLRSDAVFYRFGAAPDMLASVLATETVLLYMQQGQEIAVVALPIIHATSTGNLCGGISGDFAPQVKF